MVVPPSGPPTDRSLELEFEPAPAFRPNPLQDDTPFADARGKRIGILIVAYNAVSTIAKVLKRITPNVWRNVEEVVIFDDASQDPTFELAVGLQSLRHIPKLKALKNPRNLGYGGNQKAGYRYFIDRGFDIVVLLHGDGQYAPELLSHMYHPIVEGKADAVFGSRMMKDYGGPVKGGMPLYKYVGNRILTAFENRSLGLNLTEFHSGYRAYNLHALKRIEMDHMTDQFHFDTEIIVKLQHQGFRIVEVPIPTYYGREICYVNGLGYARDVARSIFHYLSTKRSVTQYPEYQEYYVHYPVKQSTYSSHHFARLSVGTGENILSLGCGRGVLAEEFVRKGNRVTGVDSLPTDKVSSSLATYIREDFHLSGLKRVKELLGQEKFDRILLLDVIEHVPDSEGVVRDCLDLLRPGGQVVISVPNVANITVRLMLLFGKFEPQARGILDRTHLRFFTRRTIEKLVEQQAFTIVRHRMTVIPLEVVIGLAYRNPLMRFLHGSLILLTRLMPGLFGYQSFIVAEASRRSPGPVTPRAGNP
jgi:2-polyprenyl-3-methyl-5-hydroxy-6-metoxy-1,4-benzoquinol methylase